MKTAIIALTATTLLALPRPAHAVSFRFAASSNRIYVENGGTATLSAIKAALPNAPLDLVNSNGRVWLLRANLQIEDGSVVVLHGTSAGGDVNELRILSNNSSTPESFVSITADYGELDIANTKIISWDTAASGPDLEFTSFGRAFIRVRSSLSTDGVTAQESRMNIVNSDISYLGYDASESYGLSWKVIGTHPDPTKSIFDFVNVYGNITGSHIHHSFWGVYSFGLEGGQWLNNEIDNNAGYGFDPHDDSDNLLIEGNNVHHNGGAGRGTHGIIASMRCDHLVIRNNRSWANFENGIMLHRHSDDCIIENNQTYLNGDSGIALFDSDRTTVRNNIILSNSNAGIRLTVGCTDSVIVNNEIGYSGVNGLLIVPGTDPAEPDPVDPALSNRNRRNTVGTNSIHHSIAEGLKMVDGDTNMFFGNTFTANGPELVFQTSRQIRFINNSIPATVTVELNGSSSFPTGVQFKRQPLVMLALANSSSTATFEDDAGAIFDFDQSTISTRVTNQHSFVTLTTALIGSGTTVVTRNFLVTLNTGEAQVNPTLWETSGQLRKQWTSLATVANASIQYTVGDLVPNTAYAVSKNGALLSVLNSDSSGRVTFSDTPGATSAIQFAIAASGTPPTLPTVTVTASDASAAEAGTNTGTFTISRTGATTNALIVSYSVGGTATSGSDYAALSGSVSIPVGSSSATVTVTPANDTAVETNETVVLTLSANAVYTIGTPNSATVTIADNDQPPPTLPTVTVLASDASAGEAGTNTGAFTISRTGATTNALTVSYAVGGTATSGLDYAALSGSVSIPVGSNSARVTVTPVNDAIEETNETVVLTLSANAAYTIGTPNSATVTIADNDERATTLPTVTVLASDANAAEAGTNRGTFTISRTGATTNALTVSYAVGGTATSGLDYAALSGSVSIPAGTNSVAVTVTAVNDTEVETNETVVLTLSANALYSIGTPNSATVTIADNDQPSTLPTVTVTASDPSATEAGTNTGRFSISRTGATTNALTVSYAVGGTATSGLDYAALSGSVVIPVGTNSARVMVTAVNDTEVETNETVVLTLSANVDYTIGTPNSATVTIADNDQPSTLPTVTVTASDPSATEAGTNTGRFTISRTGVTTNALTVSYAVGGTATSGLDYAALSGSVVIPVGTNSARVTVTAVNDTEVETNETVVLTLSANVDYTIGTPDSATVTIADNDQPSTTLPTVTITASDPSATEAGTNTGRFTVSRTGVTTNALTVSYAVGGTATSGLDYAALSGSVVIPVGTNSARVTVTAVNDTEVETNETVVLTLSANVDYTIGTPNSATVTIADNDQPSTLPTVTVTASDPSATEAGTNTGRFTISRTGVTTNALTVSYAVGGTATSGLDYAALSGSVVIPVGTNSARVTVTAVNDTEVETNETVVLTLSANVDYTIGTPNSATVTIADNDQPSTLPTVTVTASDPSATEAGTNTGRFTISRTGATTNALTVSYSLSGTASNGVDYAALSGSVTIPVGSASAAVEVDPIDDAIVEAGETVVITLTANAAYVVGSPNSATVTIADDDFSTGPAVVSVEATDPFAAEHERISGGFTFSRTGSTAAALRVNYSVSGTASNGSDYATLSGSVEIRTGKHSAKVYVRPVDDSTIEGNETIVVTLLPGPAYTVGPSNSATVTLADSGESASPPFVSIVANRPTATEVGPGSGSVTFVRIGGSDKPLKVRYSISGTASNGVDYSSLSGSVNFGRRKYVSQISITPIADTLLEGSETVVLTLRPDHAYTVTSLSNATVTILDGPLLGLGALASTAPNITVEPGEEDDVLSISWYSGAGQIYQLQYTPDLGATNWTDLGDVIITTKEGIVDVPDIIGPEPMRFYRVVVLP